MHLFIFFFVEKSVLFAQSDKCCELRKTKCQPIRSDVTWWRRISDSISQNIPSQILTLSNQTSRYIRKCIRIAINRRLWKAILTWTRYWHTSVTSDFRFKIENRLTVEGWGWWWWWYLQPRKLHSCIWRDFIKQSSIVYLLSVLCLKRQQFRFYFYLFFHVLSLKQCSLYTDLNVSRASYMYKHTCDNVNILYNSRHFRLKYMYTGIWLNQVNDHTRTKTYL